jgi:hypothetical protein
MKFDFSGDWSLLRRSSLGHRKMFPGAACCVGLLYRLFDELPFSVVHSVRNGNFEVPAVFLKAKQGYTTTKK